MLMTVLRGELAIKQSKALVRTFKQMKDYIMDRLSDVVYDEIYRQAKKSVFIVDNYIGLKTLGKLINMQDGPCAYQ